MENKTYMIYIDWKLKTLTEKNMEQTNDQKKW